MSDEKTKGKPQSERFKETARELECDDDEAAFEAIVRKIAKQKHAKKDEKPRKSRKGGSDA